MKKNHLLLLVIALEGYIVLATELLAIRQMVPFVGSGTEVVSIIISAVLLPLAIGYHTGGRRYAQEFARSKTGKAPSIRKLLLKNLMSALIILVFSLSYLPLEGVFYLMDTAGLKHRIVQTAIYSSVFLVYPVYLLGQTVPLISNYFSERAISTTTGRMLFFSTTGSFLGSVFSTLVLMNSIGVHHTVVVTIGLIAVLIMLLCGRKFRFDHIMAGMFFGLAWAMNSASLMHDMGVVSDNAYNLAMVQDVPAENAKILILNRGQSSKAAPDPKNDFPYIRYVDQSFIQPMIDQDGVRDVLVIGAGGFTIGIRDTKDRYTFVDIDADLKAVAEGHLLPRPLTPNKRFVPTSARSFVRRDEAQYDFIFLDVYTNINSIPMEATTREFLQAVKARLKPGGVLVSNVISSPIYQDAFSVRYHNTFASVFPMFDRQVVGRFNAWTEINNRNTLYIYYHRPQINDRTIYTDDKNTYSIDR